MSTIYINSYVHSGATPWYLAGGAPTPTVVYQPLGADSFANSNVDITGNGNLLSWQVNPAWSAANGWETPWASGGVGSSQVLTGILAGGAFTYIWRGDLAIALCVIASSSWSGGLVAHSYTDSNLYIGANATDTPRFIASISAGEYVVAYVKLSDNSQRLFFNGIEVAVAGSPKAGTAYTLNDLYIGTGAGNTKAVAIYPASTGHATWVPAVSAAMAALT